MHVSISADFLSIDRRDVESDTPEVDVRHVGLEKSNASSG
jgi:hypothetical protein